MDLTGQGGMHITSEMEVVVLGESKVGKTSIVQQFTNRSFTDEHRPTMGVDYDSNIIQVEGKFVRVHIYDISGMKCFLEMAEKQINKADGFIFVYDISDTKSFLALERWNKFVKKFSKDRKIPKILLGNKSDLRHCQEVGTATAREFGIPEGMIQLEVSARLGKCLHLAFSLLATEILKFRNLGTITKLGVPPNFTVFTTEMFEEKPAESNTIKTEDILDYTHLFKLMMVGAKRVGKTSLRYRVCKDYFTPEYIATAGFDYSTKSLLVDTERVKLQFWDVSGDDVYGGLRQNYYKGANGFLILYDVTNLQSFHKAETILQELTRAGLENAPKILIGNKCDAKEKREIDFSTAKEFADSWSIPMIEASTKLSTNIDLCYMKVVLALKRQLSPWKRVYDW